MNSTMLKKIFFNPYMREWSWPECTQKPSAWKKITFQSKTGAKLNGLYSRSNTSSKRVIVCGHPMHPLAKGYFLRYGHAAVLKEAGYDVFLFDFNGFGESENGSFDFPKDVLAATVKASEISGTRVGYLGISFGASWGISAMKYDHPVQAAFLECPFTSLEEFWINYPSAYVALKAIRWNNPSLYNRLHPIVNALNTQQVQSIRMVYGEDDKTTPAEMGRRFMNSFNTEQSYRCASVDWFTLPKIEVDMKILPDVKHAKGNLHDQYFTHLTSFFDETIAENTQTSTEP